jgi:hypothetical protein
MAVATRGITTLTSVYGWGANGSGQIGDGSYRERPVPVQITGINVPNVIGIAAGGRYAMVLGSDGTLWDWVSTTGVSWVTAPPPTRSGRWRLRDWRAGSPRSRQAVIMRSRCVPAARWRPGATTEPSGWSSGRGNMTFSGEDGDRGG